MDTTLHTALEPATSRALIAHSQIRHKLLAGEFPLDERLVEVRLAEILGVSRTPVREALARLHSEGLIARHPDGGFRPVLPDLTEITHLYRVRLGLELQAVGWPAELAATESGGHDQAILTDLYDNWSILAEDPPGADPEFVYLDEEFHLSLAEASGNLALVQILTGVNERIRIVRIHDFLTPDRVATTVAEHIGIVRALLDGDQATAGARLERHLRDSLDTVAQRAEAAIGRMLLAQRRARSVS